MNEQLQAKLVEIITSIQNATRAAADFTMEQLPDIALQYVMYGRVRSLILLLALLTVAVLYYVFIRRLIAWSKVGTESDVEIPAWIFTGVASVFVVPGWVVWTVRTFEEVMLSWLAPKVWLITKLAELVK